MAIIMIDAETANWAKFMLRERAAELQTAAAEHRRFATRHIPAAKAAIFVAERLERSARDLLAAADDINPNPGGQAAHLYR